MDAADIVAAAGLFRAAPEASRRKLIAMARPVEFARGQQICRAEDPCPGVYVVGSGLVRVYNLAPSGKEHVLQLVGPGGTILEVAAILRTPCPAFAQAVEQTTCALLPLDGFDRVLAEDHPLCRMLLNGMALRVRRFVGLLEDLVLRDALSRVARNLLNFAGNGGDEVNLPSLKKHLASHLNLTSETLSRCLRQLTDAGLISSDSNQSILILKRDELEEVAQGIFPAL